MLFEVVSMKNAATEELAQSTVKMYVVTCTSVIKQCNLGARWSVGHTLSPVSTVLWLLSVSGSGCLGNGDQHRSMGLLA